MKTTIKKIKNYFGIVARQREEIAELKVRVSELREGHEILTELWKQAQKKLERYEAHD